MADLDLDTVFWDRTESRGGDTYGSAPPAPTPPPEETSVTYRAFRRMLEEEMDLLPRYCFDELSGGVVAERRSMLSPDRVADDLYILGLYTWSQLGKQVKLFYGSFRAVLGEEGPEAYREKIRDVLRHEFRHHMETRAGEFGKGSLIEEDEMRKERYYEAHGKKI